MTPRTRAAKVGARAQDTETVLEVTIEWFVSQENRYGTHMVADLDN